jgi:hypothetical protein
MSDMPCFLRVAVPIGDAAPWDRLTVSRPPVGQRRWLHTVTLSDVPKEHPSPTRLMARGIHHERGRAATLPRRVNTRLS